MQDFIDRYERQLVAARRPRRARLPLRRPVVLAAVGVTMVVGTAAATIAPWVPDLGAGHDRGFAIAESPVPDAQLADLAVLRRPQTSEDRGAQATNALRYFSANTGGVRTNAVRVLRADTAHGAAVLVPVTTQGADAEAQPGAMPAPDSLCVFIRDATDGGAQDCYSSDDLRAGSIRGLIQDGDGVLVWGLVPDGVSAIRIDSVDAAEPIVVPVRDNFFQRRLAPGADGVRVSAFEWLDEHGAALKRLEGVAIAPPSRDGRFRFACTDGSTVTIRAGQSPIEACERVNGR